MNVRTTAKHYFEALCNRQVLGLKHDMRVVRMDELYRLSKERSALPCILEFLPPASSRNSIGRAGRPLVLGRQDTSVNHRHHHFAFVTKTVSALVSASASLFTGPT